MGTGLVCSEFQAFTARWWEPQGVFTQSGQRFPCSGHWGETGFLQNSCPVALNTGLIWAASGGTSPGGEPAVLLPVLGPARVTGGGGDI